MIKLSKLLNEMKKIQEIVNSPIPNTVNLTGCEVKYLRTDFKDTDKEKHIYVILNKNNRIPEIGDTIQVVTENYPHGVLAKLASNFKNRLATVGIIDGDGDWAEDEQLEIEIKLYIDKDEHGYWKYVKFQEVGTRPPIN